jgi:hypothetical protein
MVNIQLDLLFRLSGSKHSRNRPQTRRVPPLFIRHGCSMFGAQKPRISVPITNQSQTTGEESFQPFITQNITRCYISVRSTPIQHINIPLFKTHTRRFWCHTSSITATFFLYTKSPHLFF